MDWAGIDEWIYRRLTELVDVLPMRFVKLVAHNYTDARVRKLYWRRLGLEMGEGTYANLGLTLLSDDYTPRVHIGTRFHRSQCDFAAWPQPIMGRRSTPTRM